MNTPLSIRFPSELATKVKQHGAVHGEPTSGLVVRLVDEGLRMQDHPGVIFRDGPTGRRAALIAGPDVWEVIVVLKDYAHTGAKTAATKTAKWLDMNIVLVRVAEHYYAEFPDEINDRIALNESAMATALKTTVTRSRLYS